MEEDAIKKHVTLDGGLPWGFRMSGGSDTQMPLTITRVNAGSKAALQGIIEGDRILSINGQSTNRLTNQEAHDLLKGSGTLLQLELFQKPQSSATKMSPSKSSDTNQTHNTSGTEGQSAQSDTNTSPAKTSLKTGSPVLSHIYKCNSSKPGTWSPGQSKKLDKELGLKKEEKDFNHPPPPPVWTPSLRRSSSTERREFRPVRLDTSSLRKQSSTEEDKSHPQDREDPLKTTTASSTAPVVHHPPGPVTKSNSTNSFPGAGVQKRPPSITYKTTASVVSTPVATPTSHLPKVPNPTVTLLKKAREGQLPKGAAYLEPQSPDNNSQSTTVGDSPIRRVDKETNGILPTTATTGATTTTATLATTTTTAVTNGTSATSATAPGTTGEGAPLPLNSEAKDENYHQWYRRMYESLHRSRNPQGDFVTVRYKANKARGGYLSEPEPCEYDSDYATFSTLDRRRNGTLKDSDWEAPLSRSFYEQDLSRNQPGRIEDYEPGRSSTVEEEKKKVQKQIHIPPKSFTAFALKEAGYESDSHLVYRRKPEGETPSDPGEQKAFYRDIQRGGEVPLHGLRKTVPDKPRGPVHRFQESQVTIHYKSPIRKLQSPTGDREIDEEELKHIQAEHMRQVYEQERRRKTIQELEDIESRRHTDNLLPSQKSPIPLNRYDDFMDDKTIRQLKKIERNPEPKTMARALYNFVALNSRELPFHKGDIIYIRRRIDKNWYEGEHNAMVGIFPTNYVEIISNEGTQTMHKNRDEGNARVKYNFAAQSPVELSLIKGELVTLSRQIDENWLEGYIGARKGIFPASYVEILRKPVEKSGTNKPAGHPVTHSLMTNGSLRVNNQRNAPHVQYGRQNQYSSLPVLGISRSGYHTMHSGTVKTAQESPRLETHKEPILYRVLYPYVPQNEDELELQEGDTVYVLEMCDDGWFVGTCHRTGRFGTFPGNYVQRL